MLHAEGLELVLEGDHVVVVVMRELAAEPVTWPGRLSMTDIVRNDDEVPAGVEQPACFEKHSGEVIVEELLRRSARAVQHEHRVVSLQRSESDVMDFHLGEGLAVVEAKIFRDEVVLIGRERGSCKQKREYKFAHEARL